jgi:SAM-dependent methyltransferase
MEDSDSVEAFHQQGASAGPLAPVYEFNAWATSQLVPENGTVIDLGSGSGQYLAYLAQRRPDIRIVGFDLSRAMVTRGQRFLAQLKFGERVQLKVGDMTDFLAYVPHAVDAVSTVFALHHLPTEHHVRQCLNQLAELRNHTKCAIWIFDHARPHHPSTPAMFPRVFTPDAPIAFQEDSRNSLRASFSFGELSNLLDQARLGVMQHHLSRWLRLYQLHFINGIAKPNGGRHLWRQSGLSSAAHRDARRLYELFPEVAHRLGTSVARATEE